MPHQLAKFELSDLLILNNEEEEIPPHSIVEVVSIDFSGKRPKVVVQKPTSTGEIYVATGRIPIPAANSGGTELEPATAHAMSFDTRRWVKYTGVVPSTGDTVGPSNDSWVVSTAGSGFIVWGVKSEDSIALIGADRGADGEGSGLSDNCECNDTYISEGVTLFGGPTVCCKGHQKWTVDLGDVIGTKTLYHVSGDTWSTYNEDEELDNPVLVECYPEDDRYDVVMVLTSSEATITLTPDGEPSCDEICFQYTRTGVFACQSANQFKRTYFENAADLELPLCVCVVPAAGTTLECENFCDVSGALPEVVEAVISGVVDNTCCEGPPSFCGPSINGCEHISFGGPGTKLHPDCPDGGVERDCSNHNGTFQLAHSGECSWSAPGDNETSTPGVGLQLGFDPIVQVTWGHCNVCNASGTPVTFKVSSLIGNTEPIDCSQPLVFDTVVDEPACPICNFDSVTITVTFPGVGAPEGSGHCTSPCLSA